MVDQHTVRSTVAGLPTGPATVEFTLSSRTARFTSVPKGCARIDRTHLRCDLTATHGDASETFGFRYGKGRGPAIVTLTVTPLTSDDTHLGNNSATVTLGSEHVRGPKDKGSHGKSHHDKSTHSDGTAGNSSYGKSHHDKSTHSDGTAGNSSYGKSHHDKSSHDRGSQNEGLTSRLG